MTSSSLLVFGGPYSNLAATQAMLEVVQELGVPARQVICTGDVVAYGAQAEQTCRLIQQSGIRVVMGNCEESLAADSSDCGCGFEPGMLCSVLAEDWYDYARRQISAATRHWMAQLPREIRFEFAGLRFSVIHGGVDRINRFLFRSSPQQEFQQQLQLADCDVVIGGHCGLPFGLALEQGCWLNAGVIGLPANDASRSGWYMRLTQIENGVEVSWHRLAYDAERSFESMQAAGLSAYADTLLTGLWPSMDILPAQERAQQGCAIILPPLQIQMT
jgi:predicted phosphodiesterase